MITDTQTDKKQNVFSGWRWLLRHCQKFKAFSRQQTCSLKAEKQTSNYESYQISFLFQV